MSKRAPAKKHKKKKYPALLVAVLIILVIAGPIFFLFVRFSSIGQIHPSISGPNQISTGSLNISWPASTEDAIGVSGYGLLSESSNQAASPTASIAKILTALSVLRVKPLVLGEQGPVITISSADVNSYLTYQAEGGSVVKVSQGEQITEYQALEAMLLPSANNMADTLVNWAFGSMDNYTSYANNYAKLIGMSSTHIADASGFSPQTVSSPTDLIVLGQTALNNQTIAQIIAQKSAVIPVAGTVSNVNWLLGQNGVIGIKTGNTDQAGGCYLFAANYDEGKQVITIIGDVSKASTLQNAIDDGANLIDQVRPQIQTINLSATSLENVEYKSTWGQNSSATATDQETLSYIPGMILKEQVSTKSIRVPSMQGKIVGQITISSGADSISSALALKNSINKPGWLWVLEHPSKI
ncbi:MAG TPA: hypothetical protein VMR34_02565 [Candidatus Saccharimonadales bacterium]|nr:hypothetical protein [Candidatus Saccharimonadales bacterium]